MRRAGPRVLAGRPVLSGDIIMPDLALIALWNGRAAHRGDYDIWHTREHVPERLSVPGFLSAVRYGGGKGPLPAYFTLYTVADRAVLESAAYRHLFDNPTRWTRSMRADMTRFLRLPCTLRLRAGGGLGGWALTCLTRMGDVGRGDARAVEAAVRGLTDIPAVTAVQYGEVDRRSPGVGFAVARQDSDADGVLIVESYDGAMLEAARDEIDARLAPALAPSDHTFYKLAFALRAEERGLVPPIAPDRFLPPGKEEG